MELLSSFQLVEANLKKIIEAGAIQTLLIEVPLPGSCGRADKHESEGEPLCTAWIAQILL